MNFEAAVGSVVKIYFSTTAGVSSFPDQIVLNGSTVVISPSLSFLEIGNGLYIASYTPAATGTHCVFARGQVLARIDVVQKTSQTILKNLEDEAIGSWSWNKQAGTLTMTRQDGTALASFNVVETLDLASRERTS